MLTQQRPPALAPCLRTALAVRQDAAICAALPAGLFDAAAAECDAADAAYRTTFARVLSKSAARDALALTDAFRANVRALRTAAAAEAAAMFRRAGRAAPAFDVLDVAPPPSDGLTHVDIVRLADLGDRARARIARFRSDANEKLGPLLGDEARDALVAAKRARVAAFHGAIHAALAPHGPQIARFTVTVEALATLADGWY